MQIPLPKSHSNWHFFVVATKGFRCTLRKSEPNDIFMEIIVSPILMIGSSTIFFVDMIHLHDVSGIVVISEETIVIQTITSLSHPCGQHGCFPLKQTGNFQVCFDLAFYLMLLLQITL